MATLRRYPNVKAGPIGNRMIAFVGKYYPKASEIYVTSAMDGDHGPRPNGSHHYGLTYRNSPTAAIDFGGGGVTVTGSRRMRDFAKWLYDNFWGLTLELIHTTPYANDHGFYVKNQIRRPDGGGVYGPGTRNSHKNHIHWAVSAALMTRIEKLAAQKWPAKPTKPAPKPTPTPPVPPAPVPASGPTFFTDVSKHDWNRKGGNLDWDRIVAAGLGTATIVRATYGDPNGFHPPSDHFEEMARAAKAAGVRAVGGYHNLIKGDGNSVHRQVDFLRDALNRAGCTFGMCDVEAYAELVEKGLVPDWETVHHFNERWQTVEPDRVLAWYLPRSMWSRLGQPDLRELVGPLINADYPIISAARPADLYPRSLAEAEVKTTDRAWDPYGRRTPDIWQFSSKALVDGASSATDVNAFRGSPDALVEMLTD